MRFLIVLALTGMSFGQCFHYGNEIDVSSLPGIESIDVWGTATIGEDTVEVYVKINDDRVEIKSSLVYDGETTERRKTKAVLNNKDEWVVSMDTPLFDFRVKYLVEIQLSSGEVYQVWFTWKDDAFRVVSIESVPTMVFQ